MQKNWIGKSFGCEVNFKIEGDLQVKNIKCFTTRPDTLFGLSFFSTYLLIMKFQNFMKITMNFIKFKKNVQKQVLLKKQLLMQKKLDLKQILKAINPLNPKHKSSSIFCKFCFNGLWFWCCIWLSST